MALSPAPPLIAPPDPPPLRWLWTGAKKALDEIAARWRGIVLAHIFFLTLWFAVQVFFFATGAYWCFPAKSSKFVESFSKYFLQISQCGPAISSHGSLAAPSSLAASSPGSSTTSSPGAASSSGGSAASSSGSPPPSSPAPSAAPSSGSATAWSSRSVANCWRDRSIGSTGCYARAERHRKLPPHRSRYPAFPCRRSYDCGCRSYDCGWDAI